MVSICSAGINALALLSWIRLNVMGGFEPAQIACLELLWQR
jgi:hypothetical protein